MVAMQIQHFNERNEYMCAFLHSRYMYVNNAPFAFGIGRHAYDVDLKSTLIYSNVHGVTIFSSSMSTKG